MVTSWMKVSLQLYLASNVAGAFLHLHECHFHMVRDFIAKLKKKYILCFLTRSLLFVQGRSHNLEAIVWSKKQRVSLRS